MRAPSPETPCPDVPSDGSAIRRLPRNGEGFPEVTEYLRRWNAGESGALDRIIPLVYAELRKMARRYMAGEREGHLLQTTALINEAFLRLANSSRVQWRDRKHFFAVSAQLMRRVLVDFARARDVARRGGKMARINFEEACEFPVEPDVEILALDDALTTLSRFDPRKSRVVELRYFGGLSVKETAEVLNISEDTVLRDWSMARAWLRKQLDRSEVER